MCITQRCMYRAGQIVRNEINIPKNKRKIPVNEKT